MSTHTGIPTRYNKETSVDLIGEYINLHRLPGETLIELKARILDSYINPANSTYDGMVNGVNRELGLQGEKGIIIDVARDANDLPISRGLGVEVTTRYLTLYSDHVAGTILAQYDLRDRSDSYFLIDLLTKINSHSQFDVITYGTENYDKSAHLAHTNSMKLTLRQPLKQGSRLHRLLNVEEYNYVVSDLVFDTNMGLTTEVLTTPASDEEFMVDYDHGALWTHRPLGGQVTYWYQKFPLMIRWSPVLISRLKDDEYLDVITQQVLNEDRELVDDIPTYEGADMINEILAAAPMYWGE